MNLIISENLKYLRNKNKFTQNEVSELLGIDGKRYAAYEEKRAEPSIDMLISICKLYKTTNLYDLVTKNKKTGTKYCKKNISNHKNTIVINKIKRLLESLKED